MNFSDYSLENQLEFAIRCSLFGAISIGELNEWAILKTTEAADFPSYLIDLASFEGPPAGIYKIRGICPRSSLSREDEKGFVGIAYLRGRIAAEPAPYKKATALKAVSDELLGYFKKVFPFIALSA